MLEATSLLNRALESPMPDLEPLFRHPDIAPLVRGDEERLKQEWAQVPTLADHDESLSDLAFWEKIRKRTLANGGVLFNFFDLK